MAARLMLVAHAATAATRRAAFPRDEPLERPAEIEPRLLRAAVFLSGPELRCRQTASALGWQASVDEGLTDLDAGRWAGAELDELMAAEPGALLDWMGDPAATGHGGESLDDLIGRVGAALDSRSWPDGRSIVVAAPLVIRAAVVHLLRAPSSLVFGVDVEPLSATVLTGHGGRWKLRALMPWRNWAQQDD